MKLGVAHLLASLALLATLIGLIAFAARPPAVRARTSSPFEFSAERAMDDVRGLTFGDLPHPVGSPDHARARAYVEARLRALGVEPSMHLATICAGKHGSDVCEPGTSPIAIENIVARIEGREPGPALMLACHYDSVPTGPGAGDDGAGVATVLEIVRALKSGDPPRRTVIVLIDDGEEPGLLGARAFVRDHPWASEVRVVLNFEARGNQGQTAMFETSEQSAWLVEVYGRSAARPTASSLIYALYKMLPNDTDLTVFKRAGMLGLNFAFADRVADYHTPRDNAARLDPRSLQHMGDQGLAVARALWEQDLTTPADQGAVWFDLFSIALIHYRAWLVSPLAFATLLITALAIGWAHRKNRLIVSRVLLFAGATLLAIVGAALAGAVVNRVILSLAHRIRPPLDTPMPTWLALLATAIAVASAILIAGARGFSRTHRHPNEDALSAWAGMTLVWSVLAVVVARALPGGSYLFSWPVLASAIALGVVATLREPASSSAAWSAAACAMTVAALLWLPIVRVLLVMVGAMMHQATTVPIAMFVTLCTPLLVSTEGRARYLVPIGSAVVAMVCIGIAARG